MKLTSFAATLGLILTISTACQGAPGNTPPARFDSLSASGVTMRPPPKIYEAIEQVVDVPRFRAAGWAEFARVFAADHSELGMRWTQLRNALDEMSRDPALTPEEQSRSDARC